MSMHCDILRKAFILDIDAEILLVYETDIDDKETKRISVGGNRSFKISHKKNYPVYLLVFGKDLYSIEELNFDENGTIALVPYIKKICPSMKLVPKEEWDDVKSSLHFYYVRRIFLFENGFYIKQSSGTDFNRSEVWVYVYLKNGLVSDGKTLKHFAIEGGPFVAYWEPQKDVYDFIERMLEKGDVSMEEFDKFIEEKKKYYDTKVVYAEDFRVIYKGC